MSFPSLVIVKCKCGPVLRPVEPIGANEKRRRHRERNKLRNRELRQSVERSEYLEQQKEQTEDKLFFLRKAMELYPNATQQELAEKLGISRQHVYRLRKKIKM